MFKWILEHLKIIAISALVFTLWMTFSIVMMNKSLPWDQLTNLFVILRWLFAAMNWINDTTTMLWLIGWTLVMDIAELVFETGLIPVAWFSKKH